MPQYFIWCRILSVRCKLSVNPKNIQELSSAGRHKECIQACQGLLLREPENPIAWKYAGKSLLALRQFEKAKQVLVKAFQLDNNDPETIKDIGNVHNALQNNIEAIRFYRLALSVNPNYSPAFNNLGLIAMRQGDLAAAEELVAKARDLDQSFAPYRINLASILLNRGKHNQGLEELRKGSGMISFNLIKGFTVDGGS